MKLWWAARYTFLWPAIYLKNWLLSWLANDPFAFTYWPVRPTLILHVYNSLINKEEIVSSRPIFCNKDPIFTISISGYATCTLTDVYAWTVLSISTCYLYTLSCQSTPYPWHSLQQTGNNGDVASRLQRIYLTTGFLSHVMTCWVVGMDCTCLMKIAKDTRGHKFCWFKRVGVP